MKYITRLPFLTEIEGGIFLGVPLSDWLKVLTAAKSRDITVLELLSRFEAHYPNEYFAWRQRHGVMADVVELVDEYAQETR